MIDELEFWGVDSSSGTANADALRQAAAERLPSDEVRERHAIETEPLEAWSKTPEAQALAAAAAHHFQGPLPMPGSGGPPMTEDDLAAWIEEDNRFCKELSGMIKITPSGLPGFYEPKELPPSIVRDVQADMANHKCCDCGNPLENEATIHLHLGKLYCSRCYHAEAGS